jgi:predicted phosphodiesterase
MPDRLVVLSDMHFGTPQSSINDAALRRALVAHLAAQAPWREVVLTGDLLDANLSTLTSALEGRGDRLCGFRGFLEELDLAMRRAHPGQGLAELAGRWVYVPGNHDYKIWDLLASKVACEDVLARGDAMGSVETPVLSHRWEGEAAFFAGLFRRFGAADRVIVTYPDHQVTFGAPDRLMVLTHGHYLDPSQTRGNALPANLGGDLDQAALRRERRRIGRETAQYQAIASAISYTEETRRLAAELVGPDGLVDKLRKLAAGLATWLLGWVFSSRGALRGQALSPRLLASVEVYVERFRAYAPVPRWFVFGHTHRQGLDRTPRLGIEVFNAGSCYPDGGLPITFLEVAAGPDAPAVRLMCVDRAGRVGPSPAGAG